MYTQQDKSTAFDHLKNCLGYVSNASDTTVTISQDGATNSYIVRVGSRQYYGDSLIEALAHANGDQ